MYRFITVFLDSYDDWVCYCPFSIQTSSEYISERYISSDGISDVLYLSCARFLREYVLFLERKGQNSSWFGGNWSLFLTFVENNEVIDPNNQHRLKYLINGQFDIDVINYLIGSSDKNLLICENKAREVTKFLETYQTDKHNKFTKFINDEQQKFETFLADKQEKVTELAKILKEQEIAFNFVGLSKGFEKLLDKKNKSKDYTKCFMFGIGGALILLPILFICVRFSGYGIDWNTIHWEDLLPIAGLEFILIYFFRVILNEYKAIQTQIMQIELRQALCQFIQSYADYSKELKEKNEGSLEKFESLIFSNILSSADKLPSTFDGLDTLVNLIKESRGK